MVNIKKKIIINVDFKKINDEKEIFQIFAKKLMFPKYFGNNWDAFNDLMKDLSWLDNKCIVINLKNHNCGVKYYSLLIEILQESKERMHTYGRSLPENSRKSLKYEIDRIAVNINIK